MLISVINDPKIYKALIKMNNIGKKLGTSSIYNFMNGMLMFHPYKLTEEAYSEHDNNISVAFLHDKILSALGDLIYIPLLITGSELYQTDKEHGSGFTAIEIHDDCIKLIYNIQVNESPDEVLSKFTCEFNEKHPEHEVTPTAFTTDIVVISEYKKFLLLYQPVTKPIVYEFTIPSLKRGINDIIFQRVEKYKDESEKFITESSHSIDLDSDLVETIVKSDKPMNVKFNFEQGVYEFRLMKSLFVGYSKGSDCSLTVVPIDCNDNLFQNIIVIRQNDATICSSYKGIMY